MANIEWNRVTWYSKIAAVIVFLATFAIAFLLGILYEHTYIETLLIEALPATGTQIGVQTGSHCGGNIKNALTCSRGFHCQLDASRPDTGGVCVAD